MSCIGGGEEQGDALSDLVDTCCSTGRPFSAMPSSSKNSNPFDSGSEDEQEHVVPPPTPPVVVAPNNDATHKHHRQGGNKGEPPPPPPSPPRTPPPPPRTATSPKPTTTLPSQRQNRRRLSLSPCASPRLTRRQASNNPFSSSEEEEEEEDEKPMEKAKSKKVKNKSKQTTQERQATSSPLSSSSSSSSPPGNDYNHNHQQAKQDKPQPPTLGVGVAVVAPPPPPPLQPHRMTAQEEAAQLDDELANLDLDTDFFQSLGSLPESPLPSPSSSPQQQQKQQEPSHNDNDNDNDIVWMERYQRDEVFSHRYKPNAVEKRELQDLQTQLGGGGGGTSNNHSREENTSLWRGIFGTTTTTTTTPTTTTLTNAPSTPVVHTESQKAFKELFAALDSFSGDMVSTAAPRQPSSILLKRGTVLFGGAVNMEIVVLTHGMLLIQLQDQSHYLLLGGKQTSRRLQQAILWDDVSYCGPMPALQDATSTAWRVVLAKGAAPLEFTCNRATQQAAWLQAMERVLIQHCLHKKKASAWDLGWQYKIFHKPAFTLAVQGKDDGLILPSDIVNQLDEYNEYAPLHYAVRLDQRAGARRLLEQAGANVNVKDGEGHTPMYYALRDKVSAEMVNLLEKHGANKQNKEWKATEELFGRVRAAEEKVAAKKQQREEEERQKAAAAQSQMAENMRLMQERGQKIEEIGDKASHLNDEAQNYANMARQLKEKTRRGARGSKWLPF